MTKAQQKTCDMGKLINVVRNLIDGMMQTTQLAQASLAKL